MTNHIFQSRWIFAFGIVLSSWSNFQYFSAKATELPAEVESMITNLEKGLSTSELAEKDMLDDKSETLQLRFRNQIDVMKGDIDLLQKETSKLSQKEKMVKEIESRKKELMERTERLNEEIRRLNRKQLQKLQKRIQMTHFAEQNARKKTETGEDEIKETYTIPNPSTDDYVTLDELDDTWNSIFDANQPWEQELQTNVEKIMENILARTFDPSLKQQEQYLEDFLSETQSLEERQPSCVNKKQLKSMIHEAFYPSLVQSLHDFIPDAQIIHSNSYTSPTYSSSKVTYLLSLFGNAHTEIQNENTNLGHCWPMDMLTNPSKKEGQITFLFPHPINVRAIAIHHVSPLILTKEQRRIGSGSAPKLFHIKGYSTCDPDSDFAEKDCEEGFDEEDNWNVLSGEYVWGGGVVQYFPVGSDDATVAESTDEDESEKIDTVESIDDSFSPSAGSCTMPPDADLESDDFEPSCGGDDESTEGDNRPVQAITLIVEDNAGHEDYTCLYRLQVFGEEV